MLRFSLTLEEHATHCQRSSYQSASIFLFNISTTDYAQMVRQIAYEQQVVEREQSRFDSTSSSHSKADQRSTTRRGAAPRSAY